MSDEMRELESMRSAARELRREPDAPMLARVRQGVRLRIAAPPSPWEILAGWFRPAAISVATILVLCAALFAYAQEPISAKAIADGVLMEWEAQLVGQ